jgi:CRP/FNR family cyclic AMP-dependent transcriptional regulator
VKLANTLTTLSEAYGVPAEAGTEIFNIPIKDLSDVTDISEDETSKILAKLTEKDWLTVEDDRNVIVLKNTKQLSQLAGRA